MRFSTALAIVLLLLSGVVTSHAATTYTVSVPDTRSSSIHVAATFPLESENIDMMITRSSELVDGQAALVRNLGVQRADGSQLTTEYRGEGTWTLADVEPGQTVTVGYDILLKHDRYPWRPGIDEVAYRQGTDFLDIAPSFDALGLQLTTMVYEFYLSPREDATESQRAMARSIFGPSISISH